MTARLAGWVGQSRRVEAVVGERLRIGADQVNELVLTEPGVSRSHAAIVRLDRGYAIEDLGSRNGTMLNGRSITRARLHHLDIVAVAGVVDLVFLDPAAADRAATVGPRNVALEWLDGPEAGRVQDLPPGAVVLGRSEDAGVVVISSAVSRAHAQITFHPTGITLEDLGSANGTRLNGQVVSGIVPLRDEDEFELGAARRFRVRITASSPFPVPAGLSVEGDDGLGQTAKVAAGSTQVDRSWRTRMVAPDDIAAMLVRPSAGAASPVRPPGPVGSKLPAAPTTTLAPADLVVPASMTGESLLDGPPSGKPALGGRQGAVAKSLPVSSVDLTMPSGLPVAGPGPERKTAYMPLDLAVPPDLANMPEGAPPPQARKPVTMYAPMPPAGGVPQAVLDGASGAVQKTDAVKVVGVRLRSQDGEFTLPVGRTQIGRAPDAGLRLEMREVSRVHAAITVSDTEARLEDLGSENGTKLNGRLVTATVRIEAGDRVAFGDVEFRVDVLTEGAR